MGDFLTGSGSSQKVIVYSGLQVGTSQLDIPIAWMRGQSRMSPNAIDYVDFEKHKQSAKGKGGGKGSGQYTYSAAVDLALGWGTITETLNVWSQGSTSTTTTLGAIGFGLLTSAAWSYMVTKHPTHALTYPNISRIVNEKCDLGSSASVPDIGVEAKICPYTDVFVSAGYKDPITGIVTPGADVNMADFLPDFLTGSLGGMGMPSSYIPDLTFFREYQAAQGLFFSPNITNQEKANDIINRWAQLANSWIYDSGTGLVVVPLGDTALTANGYTYTPDITPVWNIGVNPNDFVSNPGDPPVEVDIMDEADVKNRVVVTITDRTMGYVSNPKIYKTGSLIRRYGRNDGNQVQADEIKCPAVGDTIAQLIGRRAANILKTYKWKSNWTFKRGLPGIIVTLTDPSQNMFLEPVRVTDVDEEDDGTLSWQGEQFPGNVGIYHPRPVQPGPTPSTPNLLVDPGNVNTPAVVEPAQVGAGTSAKVLIAASGGPNWGGANVYISFDGTDYSNLAGKIENAAIQGVLTAGLASYGGANPDTGHTLSVDCTISQGEPEPVTNADADALRTLSLVCAPATVSGSDLVLDNAGELLAFGDVAATGTNTADLTYLQRGVEGTVAGAHSTDDLFTLFDLSGAGGSTIQFELPSRYVGQTLWLKFASFNLFGKNTQDLSVCQSYKYTPSGAGFGGGTAGAPSTPTGIAGASSGP